MRTSFFGPIPYTRFPTTVQTRFDELDVFLSYKFSLGPIDITLGNIAFFISRRATTYEQDVLPPRFDGLEIRLGLYPQLVRDSAH